MATFQARNQAFWDDVSELFATEDGSQLTIDESKQRWVDLIKRDNGTFMAFQLSHNDEHDHYGKGYQIPYNQGAIDEEILFSSTFDFFNLKLFLEQTRGGKGKYTLIGTNSFPVAYLDHSDVFVYIFNQDGKAFLGTCHHDDVHEAGGDIDSIIFASFAAKDFSTFIGNNSIVITLFPGSYAHWLKIEIRDTIVQYNCYLGKDYDGNERRKFSSVKEARAFFVEMIQKANADKNLEIGMCPESFKEELKELLA